MNPRCGTTVAFGDLCGPLDGERFRMQGSILAVGAQGCKGSAAVPSLRAAGPARKSGPPRLLSRHMAGATCFSLCVNQIILAPGTTRCYQGSEAQRASALSIVDLSGRQPI